MLRAKIYEPIGMLSFAGSRRDPMTDFSVRANRDSADRREVAARLRTAIIEAQARRRTPRLEAVMTNDGIIVADFYGLDGNRHNSRFGKIHAQFDYHEFEEAIIFVEKL